MAAVDVLVPVFNGASYISESIQSILAQTFSDIEVHVVDDGSTDATPSLLSALQSQDRRLFVHRKENGGIVGALNYGLDHCRAQLLARHDADDLAYPDRLARQIDVLRRDAAIVATSGSARHVGPDGRPLGTMAHLPSPDRSDPTWVPAREPYLLHPFLMVRRGALEQVGRYRFVLHSEDSDLYWRLQEVGRLHHDLEPLGDYRLHSSSISSGSTRNGRIMAVSSQRAAVDAQRRRAGAAGLVFDEVQAARLKAVADSLEAACRIGEEGLQSSEVEWFRLAVATKLLQLCDFRNYGLSDDDCGFIRSACNGTHVAIAADNRREVVRSYAGMAARLFLKGRWRDARTLRPPGTRWTFLQRVALRLLLPPVIYRGARNLLEKVRVRRGDAEPA